MTDEGDLDAQATKRLRSNPETKNAQRSLTDRIDKTCLAGTFPSGRFLEHEILSGGPLLVLNLN